MSVCQFLLGRQRHLFQEGRGSQLQVETKIISVNALRATLLAKNSCSYVLTATRGATDPLLISLLQHLQSTSRNVCFAFPAIEKWHQTFAELPTFLLNKASSEGAK